MKIMIRAFRFISLAVITAFMLAPVPAQEQEQQNNSAQAASGSREGKHPGPRRQVY